MEFRLNCKAEHAGRLVATGTSLDVRVGQRILRNGQEQMWDSVRVHAREEADGTLTIRVVVFNPDWDGPLQLACIQSHPRDQKCLTPLGCRLGHVES
jgi:hypothetical protein